MLQHLCKDGLEGERVRDAGEAVDEAVVVDAGAVVVVVPLHGFQRHHFQQQHAQTEDVGLRGHVGVVVLLAQFAQQFGGEIDSALEGVGAVLLGLGVQQLVVALGCGDGAVQDFDAVVDHENSVSVQLDVLQTVVLHVEKGVYSSGQEGKEFCLTEIPPFLQPTGDSCRKTEGTVLQIDLQLVVASTEFLLLHPDHLVHLHDMRTPPLPHARLEPPHAFLQEKAVGEGNGPEQTLAALATQKRDGALVGEGEGADGGGAVQSLLAYQSCVSHLKLTVIVMLQVVDHQRRHSGLKKMLVRRPLPSTCSLCCRKRRRQHSRLDCLPSPSKIDRLDALFDRERWLRGCGCEAGCAKSSSVFWLMIFFLLILKFCPLLSRFCRFLKTVRLRTAKAGSGLPFSTTSERSSPSRSSENSLYFLPRGWKQRLPRPSSGLSGLFSPQKVTRKLFQNSQKNSQVFRLLLVSLRAGLLRCGRGWAGEGWVRREWVRREGLLREELLRETANWKGAGLTTWLVVGDGRGCGGGVRLAQRGLILAQVGESSKRRWLKAERRLESSKWKWTEGVLSMSILKNNDPEQHRMGQINCQCQYLPQEELPRSQATLAHDEELTARTALYVQLTLRGKSGIMEVRLRQSTVSTLATTEDAHHRAPPQPAPGFKLHLRLSGRNVYARDSGLGLGCFLLKRKLTLPADNSETLLAIDDQFLLLRIRPNEQTQLTLTSPDGQETRQLERRHEHEVQLEGCRVVVRREREGREYSVRRTDRGVVWVQLGEERRVKLHDVLRLGSEFFAVEGSTSYIESSKVVQRY